MSEARDSYDIIGDAVHEYWRENYPCDVVAFFWQKYDFEPDTQWQWCEEVITCTSSNIDRAGIEFLDDFCEGQTCVKDVRIVPLSDVTEFYTKHNFEREEGEDDWDCSSNHNDSVQG